MARPMPEDAPQTIAVRPSSPRSICCDLRGRRRPRGRRRRSRRSIVCSSVGQLELDDLLDAAGAELDRHAHVEAVDPVLALEVGGAGQDALLVEHDRVDHLRRRGAGRVPGGRAEQVDELAAALARALDHLVDPSRVGTSCSSGTPPTVVAETTGTIWSPWPPSTIAVTSFTERRVSQAMKAEKRAVSRMPGHADDALLREARDVLRDVAHRVERVGDDDRGSRRGERATACSVTCRRSSRSSSRGRRGSCRASAACRR